MNRNLPIAGVDEVGRGPLAGAVVAAAVILGPGHGITGLTDSKKLSEKRREELAEDIRRNALSFSIAQASVEEIDRLNILHASMLAMQRAIESLTIRPGEVLVDGNRCPVTLYPCRAIVGGDATVEEISAASILAKVYRDRQMRDLHALYPDYGFASHKGYPTKFHRDALRRLGVLDVHRRSFTPVREYLKTHT